MQRVMIVTNSLTGGGAERSMNLVGNELTKRGWPVALVPINSGPPDQVIPTCEVFPIQRKWQGNILNTIRAFWRFNLLVRSWQPDVVILNCDLPELFGAFVFSKRKIVAVEHIDRPWITRMGLGRIIRKTLELRGVMWLAVSSHLTIWPKNRFPAAILLNPIDVKNLAHVSNFEHVKFLNTKRLIFIGRLAAQKRPDWLLGIAAKTNLPVNFIGSGAMFDELNRIVTRMNVSVSFSGQVMEPWTKIIEGDLLIIPSEYEGDGLVIIEGLHHGIPMLLADIPEFRRFGFPEHNYCADVSEFTERIGQFSNNLNELIVPKRISKSILSSRTSQAVGDAWETFLNRVSTSADKG